MEVAILKKNISCFAHAHTECVEILKFSALENSISILGHPAKIYSGTS